MTTRVTKVRQTARPRLWEPLDKGVQSITGKGKGMCLLCSRVSREGWTAGVDSVRGETEEEVRVSGNRVVKAMSIIENLAYVTQRPLEIFTPRLIQICKRSFWGAGCDQRWNIFLACAKLCVQPSPKRKSRGGEGAEKTEEILLVVTFVKTS